MKLTSSRRQFLLANLGLVAASGMGLLPFQSMAEGEAKKFFLLIRLQGGWDVTLGPDPWTEERRPSESDMFVEYRHDELLNVGGVFLGPSCAPLVPYAGELSVINGILLSSSDNGHTAAMDYISSGNGQGKAPDLPVELHVASGETPYGILSTSRLNLAGRRTNYVRASDILAARNQPDPADALEGVVQDPRTPLERAVDEVLDTRETTLVLRQQLQEFARQGALSDEHVAAACFLSGACEQAEIDYFRLNLDTHGSHERNHLNELRKGFDYVASIFRLFKNLPFGEGSLFDHTTFMIVSEFARTPALNGSKGKDHNPMTNSVILAGAGIRGGVTVNRSLLIEAARSRSGASYHMASPFDFATGRPAESREGAKFIYPENVAITVANAVGADLSKFRSVPVGTAPLAAILR